MFLLVNQYDSDVLVTTDASGQLESFNLKKAGTMLKSKVVKGKKTFAISAVDADTKEVVFLNGELVIYLEPTIKEEISLHLLSVTGKGWFTYSCIKCRERVIFTV